MAELEYQAMLDAGAKMWLTVGPNSGGVEGLLLYEGRVYRFIADWNASVDPWGVPLAEFVEEHADSDARGFAELVAYASELS